MEKIFGDLNAKEVKKIEKIVAQVEAYDEAEMVGKGTHVRFIIDQQGFIDNLAKKTK